MDIRFVRQTGLPEVHLIIDRPWQQVLSLPVDFPYSRLSINLWCDFCYSLVLNQHIAMDYFSIIYNRYIFNQITSHIVKVIKTC